MVIQLYNYTTRAVLRLECSLDCISGSVGHQQNIFIFSLSALLLTLKKCNYKKCNWVSGSPSILYKLVLSPVPIVHTNFQENLLMSYSWCPQLVMCLTRHYVMTDCKLSRSSGRRFPAELPSGLPAQYPGQWPRTLMLPIRD